ncbi:MAG TPA: hypothetical protein VFQ61_30795 [Polyangiaceae bacterium]|nr:hypothetical protein [Polyangiaceae bacterium]
MRSWAWLFGVTPVLAAFFPGHLELGSPNFANAAYATHETSSPSPRDVTRIASGSLISDELLFDLCPERLVAVSYVADQAHVTMLAGRVASKLPRITANAEQILAVEPDLAVFSDFSSMQVEALVRSAGHSVARVRAPHDFDELLASIQLLGRQVGATNAAANLSRDLTTRLAALARARPRKPFRTLLVQSGYAYAEGTLQHDCLKRIGLDNALEPWHVHGTPALHQELFMLARPELVFVASEKPEVHSESGSNLVERGILPEAAARVPLIFSVPETWMGSLTHYGLRACEAYARVAGRLP